MATNLFLRINYDWTDLRVKLVSVSFLPWVYMYLLGMLVSSRKSAVEPWLARCPLWLIAAVYGVSMVTIGSYSDNASNSINPVSVVLIGMLLFGLAKRDLRLPASVTRFVQTFFLWHLPIPHAGDQPGLVSCRVSAVAACSRRIRLVSSIRPGVWFLLERKALRLKG